MAITIKEIAALAGVSIGTVDRALHNRGRVNPELAARIKQIAKTNGFEPSLAGRALALARKPLKIGVVVHLTKTPFMKQVLSGIQQVKVNIESLGAEVLVEEIPSLDAAKQVAAIDRLVKEGVHGIALSPSSDDIVRAKVDSVAEKKKIPIVTFNTDLPGSKRMSYVGMDNLRSGATAAGLMGALTGGAGQVAVITGHMANQASSFRVDGFLKEVQQSYPGIQITGVQLCFDEDDTAEALTRQSLENFPRLAGLFVSSGGQAGVCRALEAAGAGSNIKVVMYDLIPPTLEGIQKGNIDFLIDQNAYMQGYQPANLLFEYLFNGKKPEHEMQFTDIIIKNRYTL